MSKKYDEDRKLVDELCEIDSGLNDWELGFVESVTEQVIEEGYKLTDAQRDKAEQIMEEHG